MEPGRGGGCLPEPVAPDDAGAGEALLFFTVGLHRLNGCDDVFGRAALTAAAAKGDLVHLLFTTEAAVSGKMKMCFEWGKNL